MQICMGQLYTQIIATQLWVGMWIRIFSPVRTIGQPTPNIVLRPPWNGKQCSELIRTISGIREIDYMNIGYGIWCGNVYPFSRIEHSKLYYAITNWTSCWFRSSKKEGIYSYDYSQQKSLVLCVVLENKIAAGLTPFFMTSEGEGATGKGNRRGFRAFIYLSITIQWTISPKWRYETVIYTDGIGCLLFNRSPKH